MRTRTGIVLAVVMALATLLAAQAPAVGQQPGYGPWSDMDVADPMVRYDGGSYHVWGTNNWVFCTPIKVPHWTSGGLRTPLAFAGDAMPERPAWVQEEFYSDPCGPGTTWAVWAPHVAAVGGQYVLYFSARHANNLFCVGYATSPTVDGPFSPSPSPLACSDGYWNLDPYVVSDGYAHYLLWRADDAQNVTGRIVGRRLDASGTGWYSGAEPPVTLLTGTVGWEEGYGDDAGIGPIENPAMAYIPNPPDGATGNWVLTYSANRWETNDYATGYAQCATPLGPCTKNTTERPWVRSSADAPFIETSASFAGAGGMSFFTDADGNLSVALSAWQDGAANSGPRRVWPYRVAAGFGYFLREVP